MRGSPAPFMAKRYAVKVSGKFEERFFLMGSQVLLLLFFVVFLSSFATLPLSLSRRERVRQEEKNAKEYATVKIKRDERRKRKKERTKEESLDERRASNCERRNKRKSAEKLRCLPFFSSEIHRLKATTLAKGLARPTARELLSRFLVFSPGTPRARIMALGRFARTLSAAG